jgi:Zn-dependent protease with chaperone function
MRAFHRFIALGLTGVLLALWCGSGMVFPAVGRAAVPMPPAPQAVPGWRVSAAAELEATDATETAGETAEGTAEPEGDRPLPLPDFEPRLPAESLEPDDPMAAGVEGEPAADPENDAKLSKRQQILILADERYLAGDRATAEALYQQAKDDLWRTDTASLRPLPLYDPEALSPAGAVYWREAQAGAAQNLPERTRVPLELLVAEHPEFIPGQVFYARYLVTQEQAETADAMLDRALMLYPSEPDLLRARTEVQMAREKWIEASITARQFALLNPDHPEAAAMQTLAAQNLDRFRAKMNQDLTRNFVGNLLTGTAGFILTGGLFGPFTALNSAMVLMQGESGIGNQVADQVRRSVDLVKDPTVTAYLDEMGYKLAALAGRNEFDYTFSMIDDDTLNAFALPGGKIFVNVGAVMKTHSEAELAGLMAHEISHAVLSHGFQMATSSNLINSIASFIPIPEIGGIAAGLAVTGYSRQMERQSDILGTQLLAAAGYAADGLHNLMVTLEQEVGDRGGIQWFSTHPAPQERVDYLQQIVESGGYNRYAYEGVATHVAIQNRLAGLMARERHAAVAPGGEIASPPD